MRLEDDLTCRDLVELVTEYLEGALTPYDRERFEEHIAFCAACDDHLGQMRTTLELVGSLSEDDVRPEMAEELLLAFRGWERG